MSTTMPVYLLDINQTVYQSQRQICPLKSRVRINVFYIFCYVLARTAEGLLNKITGQQTEMQFSMTCTFAHESMCV